MNGATILAINPGTREIGVSVFKDAALVYYATKTTGRKRSQRGAQSVCEDVTRIFEYLTERFQPTVCALRQPHRAYQQGALLKRIYRQLHMDARKQRLTVEEFSPAFISQWMCPSGRATKEAVAQELSRRYPELHRYLREVSDWSRQYYAVMFEAVALGVVCRERLSATTLSRKQKL